MLPRVVIAIAAVLALTFAGCERDYVYRPTVATTSALDGRPASYYEVPPEAPRGYVQLTTFGFADIKAKGTSDDDRARAIHVRMVVANNSSQAWVVDTRDQLLALPKRGESRPAFARSDLGAAPLIEVPPGGKRTIDLFYPLPAELQSAEDLPAFDTIWKVQTDARLVAERTPFERLEVEPRYAYGDRYYYGWGPSYWYDPYYPRGAFIGVRGAPIYVNQPIIQSHPVAPPARQMAPPANRR
jgi:hypothetical protein